MAATESFDITTGVDLQEVDNAVNQARKEVSTRFDFKGLVAEIAFDRDAAVLKLHAADDYKLEAMWQVIAQRLAARNVPLENLTRGTAEKAAQATVRQEVTMTRGIDADTARKIVKFIKDQRYKKAQAQVQGDAVRVTGPSRDELQAVIAAVRGQDWGIKLKFGNFRQ